MVTTESNLLTCTNTLLCEDKKEKSEDFSRAGRLLSQLTMQLASLLAFLTSSRQKLVGVIMGR